MTVPTALVRLDPDTERALAIIRAVGGRPMLVGGCVRDAILAPGTPNKDIDIEVYGVPHLDVLAAALVKAGRVAEAGKAFGVLKVRAGETEIDVSLPRRDSKTGTGHRGFNYVARLRRATKAGVMVITGRLSPVQSSAGRRALATPRLPQPRFGGAAHR